MAFHSHSVRPGLFRALLISLGIHALVLLQAGFLRLPERAGPVLTVGFRVKPGTGDTPRAASLADRHTPAESRHDVLTAAKDSRAMPLQRSFATPRPAAMVPQSPHSEAGRAISPPSVDSVEGLDGDALRTFRMALATELRQFRRYPDEALKQRWGGVAEVQLPIDADGAVLPPRIARSSGHETLDAQALEMVRHAAPRAMLPEALRGRRFVLSLSIEFVPGAEER